MILRLEFYSLLFLAIAHLARVIPAEDIECFADGECTKSLFIGQEPAKDAQECLEMCREQVGCEYFTYYGQDEACVSFANCVELDNESCAECYSGNKTCPDLQCWVSGSCVGDTISIDFVTNESACLDACKNDDFCKWMTFDESDGACILLTECSVLTDCDTCWSSQVQCGERQDLTKVLVIGGYILETESFLDNVEAVDLSSETLNCGSVADYPYSVEFPVGTLLEGLPTVCGGWNRDSGLITNECYQYLHDENRWDEMGQSLLENRYTHKSSMIDSATWLITGGQNEDGVELDITEFWQNGEFRSGPFLPAPIRGHCQVTLNSSYVAILGGYNGTEHSPHFYLLDLENGGYIFLPDMPVTTRDDPCGLIENNVNGIELVILADYQSCFIYNFESMTWREGPDIPTNIYLRYNEMTVQMEKTFYVLGGVLMDQETTTDAIFKFDNENYVWILETARLEMERAGGVAISVPDEIVNCS